MLVHKSKILIFAVNLVLICTVFYTLFNLATIPLFSPSNGEYTTERQPEFRWGGIQGEFTLFLDENPDFKTPIIKRVRGNSYKFENPLDFGTYYWKVESSGVSSEVRKLTIGSSVVLSRDERKVKNEGNTDILLHSVTGAMVLGVGNAVEIGEDENVTAEQI